MSARPVTQKKRRRAAKALRRQPLPAFFDLIQWLIDNRHASTKRQAREIILAKRVKADSHPIGVVQVPQADPVTKRVSMIDVVDPRVPAAALRGVTVSAA